MRQKLVSILGSIFPLYCHCCDTLITSAYKTGFYYCEICYEKVQKIFDLVELYRKDLNGKCSNFFSVIDYHQLKAELDLVSAIKRDNKSFLLRQLLLEIPTLEGLPKPDEILFIPLSFRKYLERGFNPSYLIAQFLGRYFGVPVRKLLKKKDVLAQSSKNRKERLQSMEENIFQIKTWKYPLKNTKSVLVVDDIITTGATLSNVAGILEKFYPENTKIIGFGLFHSEG